VLNDVLEHEAMNFVLNCERNLQYRNGIIQICWSDTRYSIYFGYQMAVSALRILYKEITGQVNALSALTASTNEICTKTLLLP
jgi:hypothetical protein